MWLTSYIKKVFQWTVPENKEKNLHEIISALEGIDSNKETAREKLRTLIEQNNQLKNDYGVLSSLSDIPYLSSFDPKSWEINRHAQAVEGVKNTIKLRIVDLLEQNDDAKAIHFQQDLVLSEKVKGTINMLSKTFEISETLSKYGIDLPSGLIFFGPPGVGKTESARWISTHNDLNFKYISMSDIVHGIVGSSEKTMTEVFQDARSQTLVTGKPTIIFLDEADKLLGDRKTQQHSLVQHFLSLVDGFYKNKWTIVILSTNQVDMIDTAVLSRMTEKVAFELPTPEDCVQLLHIHLHKGVKDIAIKNIFTHFLETHQEQIATLGEQLCAKGASGRDIKNITQTAKRGFVLRHVENTEETFTLQDLHDWIHKVLGITL